MLETISSMLLGISLLLFGSRMLRQALESLCAHRLSGWLQEATRSPGRGLVFGFLMSLLIPSSTGVATVLAETAASGLVKVRQLLTVCLGAQVGLTVIVQLLSLPIYSAAPGLLIPGIGLTLFAKRDRWKLMGSCACGLGFILYGMGILSLAASGLKESENLCSLFHWANHSSILVILLSALLAVLLQSSTAALALLLVLVVNEILSIEAGMIGVLGVNVGIGISALLVSLGNRGACRLAIEHLGIKILGLLIALPVIWYFPARFEVASLSHRLLADINTLFNIGCVLLIFIPSVPAFCRWIVRWTPLQSNSGPAFRTALSKIDEPDQ